MLKIVPFIFLEFNFSIPLGPDDTNKRLRAGIRVALLHYCGSESIIFVDTSANCGRWICDRNRKEIQFLGSIV